MQWPQRCETENGSKVSSWQVTELMQKALNGVWIYRCFGGLSQVFRNSLAWFWT